MFHKIAVICTGNICRSPMAESLLSRHLSSPPEIRICSAGTQALVNYPADPLTLEVMREHGHDVSEHRARQATQAVLSEVDLILVMDQSHLDWIRARFPQFHGRTYKLGRWSDNADVADPYRRPKAAFEQAFAEIDRFTAQWVRCIRSI